MFERLGGPADYTLVYAVLLLGSGSTRSRSRRQEYLQQIAYLIPVERFFEHRDRPQIEGLVHYLAVRVACNYHDREVALRILYLFQDLHPVYVRQNQVKEYQVYVRILDNPGRFQSALRRNYVVSLGSNYLFDIHCDELFVIHHKHVLFSWAAGPIAIYL